VVASVHPTTDDGKTDYSSQFLVFSDQATGWTERASSASDLATRIREEGPSHVYDRAA
jgi:hypothetical protein